MSTSCPAASSEPAPFSPSPRSGALPMGTNLMLHAGAREVSLEELNKVAAPAPTKTWFPIPHRDVLSSVLATLTGSGFSVEKQRLALSRGDARFFGTLDLKSELAPGVALAVGVRNSIDQSFPLG